MEPKPGFTRNRLFGLIGVLWGGLVLLSKLMGAGAASTNRAYGAGQTAGYVLGGALFVVGLYYLIKG